MGTLVYDSRPIQFEDRLLAHLQAVIAAKLCRCESLVMSWRDPADAGARLNSVWLHRSIALYFRYDGSRPPTIDKVLLARLTSAANSPHGLTITGPASHERPPSPKQAVTARR